MILDEPIKKLYSMYLKDSGNNISYGSFLALKPFYVRGATTKDVEMCCCKDHLHARWAIKALIQLCHNQGIRIDFDTYLTFFDYLTSDCLKDDTAHINWECTPSKKLTCQHISFKWTSLSKHLCEEADENNYVPLQHFEKQLHTSKKGIVTKKLKAITKSATMKYITEFISSFLPKIVHHRNQLRHFRSSINTVRNFSNHIQIDIDFSENLSVPIKFEPQSMHWSQAQITIHSGILKIDGEKYYCPGLADDLKHDQKFVKLVIDEILKLVPSVKDESVVMIESDNCSSQYKSAEHFHDLQVLSDRLNRVVVRMFGIAGHGKGEVDHVGGLVKVTIRREIAADSRFESSNDMVTFLTHKFEANFNPFYYVFEIEIEILGKLTARIEILSKH